MGGYVITYSVTIGDKEHTAALNVRVVDTTAPSIIVIFPTGTVILYNQECEVPSAFVSDASSSNIPVNYTVKDKDGSDSDLTPYCFGEP